MRDSIFYFGCWLSLSFYFYIKKLILCLSYFWVTKSTIKESYFKYLVGRRRRRPLQNKSPSIANRQNKKHLLYPLFLLKKQAQKKKLSKRKRRYEDWHICEACVSASPRRSNFALCGARPPTPAARASLWKGLSEISIMAGENFILAQQNFS